MHAPPHPTHAHYTHTPCATARQALDWIQATLRVGQPVAFGLMLACIAASSFTFITTLLVVCGGFPNGLPQALQLVVQRKQGA